MVIYKRGGGGRASLEESRPTGWQGRNRILRGLAKELDFIHIPRDETDRNQDLLQFRKMYCM